MSGAPWGKYSAYIYSQLAHNVINYLQRWQLKTIPAELKWSIWTGIIQVGLAPPSVQHMKGTLSDYSVHDIRSQNEEMC